MVIDLKKIQEENKRLKKGKKGKLSKGVLSKLSKKVKSKRILKPSKTTLIIKEHTPEPYVPIYFENEIKEAKRSMFLE